MTTVLAAASDPVAELLDKGDVGGLRSLLHGDFAVRPRELLGRVLDALSAPPANPAAATAIARALQELTPDGDGFARLADRLTEAGAGTAALEAGKGAAALDFDDNPAIDVWGGPFNDQARRQALFDQLLARLDIAAIVETGTFRGTSTAYMAKTGKPVFSCELDARYFHYAALRLARFSNVRLERADSRRFLADLFAAAALPEAPTLFYLDAHWQQDLPLWEEISLIFARHPAPAIMIDDFRVPTDSGFSFDDYGPGRCLSVTDLYGAVGLRPALFFPNHAAAQETGARRGCAVLALGAIAAAVRERVPLLTELGWSDALVLDGIAALRADMARAADQGARLAAVQDEQKRLEARVQELSGALERAELFRRQQEQATQDARREAAAAREAGDAQQRAAERLGEELRRANEELRRTNEALHRTNEELRVARARTAELQRSRWRRLGLQLGLTRKASFED